MKMKHKLQNPWNLILYMDAFEHKWVKIVLNISRVNSLRFGGLHRRLLVKRNEIRFIGFHCILAQIYSQLSYFRLCFIWFVSSDDKYENKNDIWRPLSLSELTPRKICRYKSVKSLLSASFVKLIHCWNRKISIKNHSALNKSHSTNQAEFQ